MDSLKLTVINRNCPFLKKILWDFTLTGIVLLVEWNVLLTAQAQLIFIKRNSIFQGTLSGL